jgi:glycosyltransferase involved in cell wall biosynthesis
LSPTHQPNCNQPGASPSTLVIAFQHGKRADGGLESLYQIAKHLPTPPILITQTESDYARKWRELGARVEVWPVAPIATPNALGRRLGRFVDIARLTLRLTRFLRKNRIRVIHCNDGSAMALAAPAARLTDTKILLNVRDTLLVNRWRWRAYRALSDHVVVLSREMQEFALEILTPLPGLRRATPVSSIYSGIDLQRMSRLDDTRRGALRAELGIPSSTFAIGVVGALVKKKRQLELLKHLRDHGDSLAANARLYLVGDCDPERDAYARACTEVAETPELRDRVRLCGFSATVEHWYQALDLTLLASTDEGLARSTIESIACGTPVVSFDFCSAREVLEQHLAGVVVSSGDFAALFRSASDLSTDPSKLALLSANGERVARELFAPETAAHRYQQLYAALGNRSC